MATLEMSDDEFVAESRSRERKISSILLLLSISSHFLARMLADSRTEDAINIAWVSVILAVAALILLIVIMPIRKLIRKRKKTA